MPGHTIIGATQAIRALWDTNPPCTCEHTWRSHLLKKAGGPCGVSHCLCQAFERVTHIRRP